MNCDLSREMISAYIDEMLDEKEAQQIKEHLESCEDCRKYYEELKAMTAMTSGALYDLPENFHKNLMDQIAKEPRPKRSIPFRFTYLSAAAAAIILAITYFGMQNGAITNNLMSAPNSGTIMESSGQASYDDRAATSVADDAAKSGAAQIEPLNPAATDAPSGDKSSDDKGGSGDGVTSLTPPDAVINPDGEGQSGSSGEAPAAATTTPSFAIDSIEKNKVTKDGILSGGVLIPLNPYSRTFGFLAAVKYKNEADIAKLIDFIKNKYPDMKFSGTGINFYVLTRADIKRIYDTSDPLVASGVSHAECYEQVVPQIDPSLDEGLLAVYAAD